MRLEVGLHQLDDLFHPVVHVNDPVAVFSRSHIRSRDRNPVSLCGVQDIGDRVGGESDQGFEIGDLVVVFIRDGPFRKDFPCRGSV